MQELEEIKLIFKNNVIKIILIVISFAFLFYSLFYFNFWIPSSITDVKENVKQASQFTGFTKHELVHDLQQSSRIEAVIDKTDNHLIIYGATETGKTTFIRKYTTKYYQKGSANDNSQNVFVYCKDLEEWSSTGYTNVYEGTEESLSDLADMECFQGTKENRNLIILDDMGNLIPQKLVSSIYTKGRHYFIQIIVLAHKPKDVDNKIRENVKIIYSTTMNNNAFFKDLNESYHIKLPLTNYKSLDYGMIQINLIKETYIVYDKDLNVFYDSSRSVKIVSPDFNIAKYLNVKTFSEREKDEIITFLENESKNTINITNETFLFYLNYYLIQVLKLQPNFSKLKKMVTESRKGYRVMRGNSTNKNKTSL
jgi:hypothetical protein